MWGMVVRHIIMHDEDGDVVPSYFNLMKYDKFVFRFLTSEQYKMVESYLHDMGLSQYESLCKYLQQGYPITFQQKVINLPNQKFQSAQTDKLWCPDCKTHSVEQNANTLLFHFPDHCEEMGVHKCSYCHQECV